MTDAAKPEFYIQRLYVKDVSFESPVTPEVFKQNIQPMIELNINTTPTTLEPDIYEVTLSVTVNAHVDKKTIFLVEVKQAGIFTIKNIPEENMDMTLNAACPTILFPYLRETVSDLVARGGFQHFYLTPINFEALYLNNLQQKQTSEATTH